MVKYPDRNDKREIVRAIQEAERLTSGEIRVHLKKKCGDDVFWEAKKVFERLRMHRTKEKNGVLIFVALGSRRFAVLGDSGIHREVGDNFWKEARDTVAAYFSKGEIKEGIVAGVLSVGEKLKKHFPAKRGDRDELPDTVTGG